MKLQYENQGPNTYLVYEVAPGDDLDTMSLGMLTNNAIAGFAAATFTQLDTTKYIKYNVSAKVSASQLFMGAVNKKRLIGVFSGIVDAMICAEDYMLDTDSVLLDLDYIYADVSTCDTVVICLPVIRPDRSPADLNMFFKSIMFSTQFDQTENCDYVAQILSFLNSSPILSLTSFKELLDRLKESSVQAPPAAMPVVPSQPVQPQPAPVQPQPVQPQPEIKSQPAPQQISQNAPAAGQIPGQSQSNVRQNPGFQMPGQPSAPNQGQFQMGGQLGMPNQGFQMPGQQPASAQGQYQAPANAGAMPAPKQEKKEKGSMFGFLFGSKKEKEKKEKKAPEAKQPASSQGFQMPGKQPPAPSQGFQMPGKQPPAPSQGFQMPGKQPPAPNQGFQMPGKQPSAPSQGFQMPGQPAPNQGQFQGGFQPAAKPPVQQTQPAVPQSQPAPQSQPVQQPAYQQPQAYQASVMPGAQAAKPLNFGETTVLSSGVGETTVLGAGAPEAVRQQPHLIRTKNNERIPLNKPVFRIGKEKSYVDYFVGDNTAISRSHANIINRGDEFFVVDTNSTNHTYVNGGMIPSNVETKLTHGTKICLANEDFEFKLY